MNFNRFKYLFSKIGIDKSIAYSSGARLIQAFTGIISVFFISSFLSETEQGFYYTFGSLLALQVFFELGLANILTQYVAFESANLKWQDDTKLIGENINISRLSHLLHFSFVWYGIIAILFLIFLVLGGFLFFSKYSSNDISINWTFPWYLVSISTVLNFYVTPFLAILTGLDKVKEVAKLRFFQQIIIPTSLWIGLSLNLGLYVLGISQFISFLLCIIWIFYTPMYKILLNIWKKNIIEKVNYKNEIFPYQWKIAISWISGYFVMQLFNPILFASEGPVIAGQMGMSLVALSAISSFSQSWINTKIPNMTKMIAKKEYSALDILFNKSIKQLGIVFLILVITFFLLLFIIRISKIPIGNRFLSWVPMILIAIPIYVSQYVNSWATYLRCHKKEPLLLYSIITGILCCISAFTLGMKYGVIGMTGGYCIIICTMSIWAYRIYVSKKRLWHS